MSDIIEIVTPVGRLVSGDVFAGSYKDPSTGRPRVTRAGQPRTVYFIGVALPKSDPATAACIAKIRGAAAEFRNGEPDRPDFAWKYVDGDSTVPNMKGKRPCDQEGFAGNYVLKFSTSFAPKAYTTANTEIIDPAAIKRGDYLRVAGTVKANGDAQRPGVYLSHNMVQFVRAGAAISVGRDPADAFGGAPAPRPAQGFGAAPPPPAGPAMAPGCPYTYEQLRAQGWSDQQMIAAGHLLSPDFIPY